MLMAKLIRVSSDRIMSLALLKVANVFLIWLSAMKICELIFENHHFVSLSAAPTIHPNHEKLFHWFAILYRSMECIIYHLVLVGGLWKSWKFLKS